MSQADQNFGLIIALPVRRERFDFKVKLVRIWLVARSLGV